MNPNMTPNLTIKDNIATAHDAAFRLRSKVEVLLDQLSKDKLTGNSDSSVKLKEALMEAEEQLDLIKYLLKEVNKRR
jgi:ribosomal protein L17